MVPSNKIVIHPRSLQHLNLPFFDGFPYLVTRVVPTLYHIALLPEGSSVDELCDIAQRQFQANKLDACLVVSANQCLFLSEHDQQWTDAIPRGGIPITEKLALCTEFTRMDIPDDVNSRSDLMWISIPGM